ncbi:MAG: cyclic nucleotide-binding domain-containing protein [Betaproteobacteria bacterium]|nr:cyclic nucleotide-binding domain-containing protein [Betaproteobacteria bacterium]
MPPILPDDFPAYIARRFATKSSVNASSPLSTLESLGSAATLAKDIFDLIGRSRFFDDFRLEDVEQLATYMQAFRAAPGGLIIREGAVDDYMLLIVHGKVEIVKTDKRGNGSP